MTACSEPPTPGTRQAAGATLGRYQNLYNSTNLTSRSDNDGSVTSFGYDGANQLTSEARTGPGPYTIGYVYDNNGNRTQKTLNGVPEVYTYGANDRILTAGGRPYGYDNNGNVTNVTAGGQSTVLTHDFENRLTRIDYPGGSFNTFKYNGLGLRVQKVDSSGTQNYVTDGSGVASPVIVDTSATTRRELASGAPEPASSTTAITSEAREESQTSPNPPRLCHPDSLITSAGLRIATAGRAGIGTVGRSRLEGGAGLWNLRSTTQWKACASRMQIGIPPRTRNA